MLFPSINFAIQSAAKSEHMAQAVAMYAFLKMLGQCLGIAVGGVIFQNTLKARLEDTPGLAGEASEYAKNAVALVQYIKSLPHDSSSRRQLIQAYAGALKIVWISMCGFAVVAMLASLCTKGLSMDRKLETEQGLEEEDRKRSTEIGATF
jgi:hypothetical protein